MKKIVFAILAIVVIAALILVLPVSKENTRETVSDWTIKNCELALSGSEDLAMEMVPLT